jgi:hypothetical protein
MFIIDFRHSSCRSQWPRSLRRGSTAVHLLGLCVWFPPGAWMFVSCECYVLSGRGLLRWADHLSREVLPSVVCLAECDHEALIILRPWPTGGYCAAGKVSSASCSCSITDSKKFVTMVGPFFPSVLDVLQCLRHVYLMYTLIRVWKLVSHFEGET